MKKHTYIFTATAVVLLLAVSAPVSAFYAKVQTPSGVPLEGVKVTFAGFDSTAYSDVDGIVSFRQALPVIGTSKKALSASICLSNWRLFINMPEPGKLDVRLYSISGRMVFREGCSVPSGMHAMFLPAWARGIYILRIGIGENVFIRKVNFITGFQWQGASSTAQALGKRSQRPLAGDTAFFTKTGYGMVKRPFAHLGDNLGIVFLDSIRNTCPIKAVAVGDFYTMILKQDNTLWAAGINNIGQLGDGTATNKPKPIQIMSDVAAVSTGANHTMMLKLDGTLWTAGSNYYGQLGDGTTINKSTPIQVASGVTAVSAGSSYSMILKKDTLWAAGWNDRGQLGDGTITDKSSPVPIMRGVAHVFAGFAHTMIINGDNTLWATGNNVYGQLDDGTSTDRKTPLQVMTNVWAASAGFQHTMILTQDGALLAIGDNYWGQLGDGSTTRKSTPVQIMAGVASVCAGQYYSMVIKQDGTLWATGYNNYGQLGDGTTASKSKPTQIMSGVSAVSAGISHTMVIKQDGSLWGAGRNAYGEICDGTAIESNFFKQVLPVPYYGLTVSGGSGSGTYVSGDNISISANDSTAAQRIFDHWGGADSVSVSDCANRKSTVRIPSGNAMTIAVYRDFPTLTVIGGTGTGRYMPDSGVAISANDSTAATRAFDHWAGKDSGWVVNDTLRSTFFFMSFKDAFLTAIFHRGCMVTFDKNGGDADAVPQQSALLPSGRRISSNIPKPPHRTGYWFAGWNRAGDGSGPEFTDTSIVADDITVFAQWIKGFISVAAGDYYSMILGQEGSLWVTGSYLEHLTLKSYTWVMTPERMMNGVSAAGINFDRAIILKTDKTLWAVGLNMYGALGTGDTNYRHTSVQVSTGISAFSLGGYHTMILKQDGTLWATGENQYGQLGDGTTVNKSTPVQVLSGVSAVSCGALHSMILKLDGTLWAAGYNNEGQLGDGTTSNRPIPVQVMSGVSSVSSGHRHTMILKRDGTLWATGDNLCGQLGTGDTLGRNIPVQVMSDVLFASAGDGHTMIIKQNNTLWATGSNEYGQLGIGDTLNRSAMVQVMSKVSQVSAGGLHTLIIKDNGSVWATGFNGYGQFGDGTNINKSIPVQVMPLP
jgi:uncharacterized repeat protein (TIGR02543 family)